MSIQSECAHVAAQGFPNVAPSRHFSAVLSCPEAGKCRPSEQWCICSPDGNRRLGRPARSVAVVGGPGQGAEKGWAAAPAREECC